MKHTPLQQIIRAALCLVVLVGLGLTPPPQTASAQDDQRDLAVFILVPLARVYEGDTLSLGYMVEDLGAPGGLTLAPLTPGEASATASLGSVSAEPNGLFGTLTYTAEKHGQEQIVLQVSNALGSGVGTLDLTIYPRPNYDLSFMMVSEDEAETGGFRAVFTGEGSFANVPDAPISGTGHADLWFNMWVATEPFACVMEPTVQGAGDFKIVGGQAPVVPLLTDPGFIMPFTLNLLFDPIQMNAASLVCEGLGGISANIPWPAAEGNPNEYPLTNLYFPGEGGVAEISAPKTWGYVFVTRREP